MWDRASGTGNGGMLWRYGPNASERTIGRIAVSNTDPDESLSGGTMILQTSTTGGTNTTFMTADSAQAVSFTTSSFTHTHTGAMSSNIVSTGSNTSASLFITIDDAATTADAKIVFREASATHPWTVGRDTSNSYLFCIANSQFAGTTNALTIAETTGLCTFGVSGQTPAHRFNAATQSTVGAAGGASALPATPTGYIEFNINGTAFVVPYFAKA